MPAKGKRSLVSEQSLNPMPFGTSPLGIGEVAEMLTFIAGMKPGSAHWAYGAQCAQDAFGTAFFMALGQVDA